jgi:murein L,D-transpeptidase YafK
MKEVTKSLLASARSLLIFVPILFLCIGMTPPSFREKQLKNTRVREAYRDKEKIVVKTLAAHAILRDSLRICLRAFKTEKKIEVWAKNSHDSVYVLVRELPICELSGYVGPKRRSHDLQVPEGFYHIDGLNPYSKYYLSMKINYPNASDSVRGVRRHLGSQIFIHGSCISSGCLAITDDKIKELFVYCIEAYNSGQEEIGITIYPARLNDVTYSDLIYGYGKYKDMISLWADLKKSWDLFEKYRVPPTIKFLPNGGHEVTSTSAGVAIY